MSRVGGDIVVMGPAGEIYIGSIGMGGIDGRCIAGVDKGDVG